MRVSQYKVRVLALATPLQLIGMRRLSRNGRLSSISLVHAWAALRATLATNCSPVLTVEFTVVGIPCIGLNGGPVFKHNEAFSFQVATDDQSETGRSWNVIIGDGGHESACG